MILIISIYNDVSTSKVIDWLNYYDYPYIRLNFIEDLCPLKVKISDNFEFFAFNCVVDLKTISAVWYRRRPELKNKTEIEDINTSLNWEFNMLFDYLHSFLFDRYWLNLPYRSSVNKLWVLNQATKFGLKIPHTIITNNKKDIIDFKNIYKKIITKPIHEIPNIIDNGRQGTIRTKLIDDTKILPNTFFPSLFQEYIEKEIELRIVYLEKEFYCMGILSQQNLNTMIDFRNYDTENPNRYIPVCITQEIKDKITALMNFLDINFGSIDMILSKTGEYYFLEINPVGQFGMTSTPCNYNLEKKIAELLINKSKEYEGRIHEN